MDKPKKSLSGTLFKLALVVGGIVILLLAVVYVPAIVGRYGLVGQQEKSTKGGLDQLRSALKLYVEDHGTYPTDPAKELIPQYLREIPEVAVSPQAHFWPSHSIIYFDSFKPTDSGTWGYVTNTKSADFGKIFINCTHTDVRGAIWNAY